MLFIKNHADNKARALVPYRIVKKILSKEKTSGS